MTARDDLIDEYGRADTAPLGTLSELRQKLDAYRAEVLTEVTNPAAAATIYADRLCACEETPHPTWCPASIPTDERITEIRQGAGEPLTRRELSWLTGAAARHELHVIGARGLHWPLTDDLPGALLLVSQYLAAAVAVIERAGLAVEEATAAAATATPDFFQPGHTYTREHHGYYIEFRVRAVSTSPDGRFRAAHGWRTDPESDWELTDSDDLTGWTDVTEAGGGQ